MDKRIFKASEINSNETGWIADLSPADVVNPDCYFHFSESHSAELFLAMVDNGIDARRARYLVDDYNSKHSPAAALGRKGGKSTSEAKKASSAANGKGGGRCTINTVRAWLEVNRPDLGVDEIDGKKGIYSKFQGQAFSFTETGKTWRQVLNNLKSE